MDSALLSLGESKFMIGHVGDADFDALMKQPDEIGGAETQLTYVVVTDPDAHFAHAKRSGASVAIELGDYKEGGRGYACRDLEGHVWNFGSLDPWTSRSPHVSTWKQAWWTRSFVAAALMLILAGAAGAAWKFGTLPGPSDPNSAVLDVAGSLPTSPSKLAAQSIAPAEQHGEERHAAAFEGRLQAAVAAEAAALRAVAELENDLKNLQAANDAGDARLVQLSAQLDAAHSSAANIEKNLQAAEQALMEQRDRLRSAEDVHTLQRQQLENKLVRAESDHRQVTEQLEQLMRERMPTVPSQSVPSANNHDGAPAIAPSKTRQPSPRVLNRQVKESSLKHRASLRRRCAEIRSDPDGYEAALVDLCQAL